MSYQDIISKFLSRYGKSEWAPKAALIDMDGTLYDSMKNHASAWVSVADEAGFDLTPEEVYLFEGRTGASTINELVIRKYGRPATDNEKKDWYYKKTVYFNKLPRVEAMPGAREMLGALRDAGITRVLVTGSGQSSLLSRLDTDFPGIFTDNLRITSADCAKGKPDPEPYLKAMALAGVQPWEAIAIENAPLGVRSAHDAGVFTIGVVTGPIPEAALANEGADVVFPSMPRFAEEIKNIICSN